MKKVLRLALMLLTYPERVADAINAAATEEEFWRGLSS